MLILRERRRLCCRVMCRPLLVPCSHILLPGIDVDPLRVVADADQARREVHITSAAGILVVTEVFDCARAPPTRLVDQLRWMSGCRDSSWFRTPLTGLRVSPIVNARLRCLALYNCTAPSPSEPRSVQQCPSSTALRACGPLVEECWVVRPPRGLCPAR